jgi:hypothetical protein
MMIINSKPINIYDDFSVWEIGVDRASDVTKFVFEVYYDRFSKEYQWEGEYEKLESDDKAELWNSTIYAALNREGGILATIRTIERADCPLPIERDFNVDIFKVCREKSLVPNRIFEGGRFAKSTEKAKKSGISRARSLALMEELLACTVYTCSQEKNNIWFSTIDTHVLYLLRSRGLRFSPIGETDMNYLGSPTVPVCLPIDECRDYMREFNYNRYLKYFRPMVETVSHSS